MFGVQFMTCKQRFHGPSRCPAASRYLRLESVLNFRLSSWDWEAALKLYRNTDRLLEAWHFTGYFERLISFLDFSGAAVAIIDEDSKPYVHSLFRRLTDLYKEIIAKEKKYFDIDMVYFHDDWGGQRGPFFSADTCREMMLPYIKEIVDFCHENEIIFDFHCCGKNEMLVPVMIEAGMDAWSGQPINDKEMLHRKYGDKIMLGINSPFRGNGTEEEVQAFCTDFVAKYWPTIVEKPVYLVDTFPDDRVRRIIYKLSRSAEIY